MKQIILFFVVISMFGCSSDGVSENPTETTKTKLIKEVETNLVTNKTQTLNYFYSGDVLIRIEEIESDGQIYKTEFNYNNNRVDNLAYFKNGIQDGSNTFTYENSLITKSVINESNINFINSYIYESGKLKIEQKVSFGKIDSQKSYEYKNTATNGVNTTIETIYDSKGVVVNKITYESDSENTPYLNIFPDALSNITLVFSVQNISKKTLMNGEIYVYEYKYENHKPIQVIEKLNGVSQSKTTFTYQ